MCRAVCALCHVVHILCNFQLYTDDIATVPGHKLVAAVFVEAIPNDNLGAFACG